MRPADQQQTHTIPPDRGPMEDQPRWRQDFPIDVPQDQHLARREFTKFMVLTSLAFVVGQFWIAVQNLLRKGRGKPPIRRIASVDDVPVGGAIPFTYPTEIDGCLLIRPAAATFLAYSSRCTHLTCPVLPQVERGRLHCPCHRGYFDLETGNPLEGPPRRPLPAITLETRNGDVYATGVEART